MTMKIAIASDHAGYQTKNKVIQSIKESGYDYTDFGTNSDSSVDYPDFAFKVAKVVSAGKYTRGILICGSGLGMCIAANKVKGIRAVTCHNTFTAEMSRRHNDANVLCLGAKVVFCRVRSPNAPRYGTVRDRALLKILKIWLETEFESEGGKSRHQRRLNKISEYEMKSR